MQPAGKYAERTQVSVAASIEEAKAVLRRYGVEEIAVVESPRGRCIAWRYEGAPYRIAIDAPPSGPKKEQQERQQWRAVVLVLKAILETGPVAGMNTRAMLLPYMQLPTGQTVAEAAPQIQSTGWAALMPKD